ncbi:BtrH N-terminal domain-containing protein [Cellulosilyticum ruminicola]|uniref:BtrH N-terminal domain-containing protein n=1 Tax=Cellulosilyticum ruminicola TaxID=425254 RepID=UPI00155DADF2|nr:BtrH N-terminal domain-containing protein [Cellulosilyticum ruminicola]
MKEYHFISKEQYNCLENVWVTLLTTRGVDYPLMFAENWGFTLFPPEEENQIIGFRIGGGEYKVLDCLSNYIGIHTKYYETEDIEAQIALLNKELEDGHDVIVEADSYYFPWKLVGERHNFIHYGLIVGKDEITGDYQCLDPFENSDLNPLSRENLVKGKLHCMTIRKGEAKKDIIWQDIVKHAAM